MRFRRSIIPTVFLLIMSMGLFYEAEAKTVAAGHATVSWKGKGVIDDLGYGNRVFGGTVTGIILVKHLPEGSAPAEIHAGKLDCQAIFRISENSEERHTRLKRACQWCPWEDPILLWVFRRQYVGCLKHE